MGFVDITSDQHAIYGTHSHAEEGFAPRIDTYPAQLKWSDLHPPGVTVLPKGSPPAGPGEINWEDTLGGKFALAIEKLEGLLYAVYGSRPNGDPKRQWYDRQHPRCLWGPEMWQRRLILGPTGCHEQGQCFDYEEGGKEYAALGEYPPCCPMPQPQVPIRSRSGDPNGAFVAGLHDRTYFPIGSVSRDFATAPFDPQGHGWFGATQPGRQDGVGYEHRDGDAVTFRWTKSAGVATPTTVQLWWKRRLPSGAWSSWDAMTMSAAGDTYSATWSAQPHGTELRWYIRYFYDDPDPEHDDVTKFDPGRDSAPTDAQANYLQWFTHFNPYERGLPEMLEDYGGVNVRHGTDFYQFDGSETIQPELINMCRWILSWFGGDCCGGEFDSCAETDDRTDRFHHNPRFRGGDDGLCCIPMPIRFRWSGSNVHPHYTTGGKGLVDGPTPDPRPLHNHPNHKPGEGEAWGSSAARKTWRGINLLYADDLHFDNPYYGGGYSWGTAPGTFVLMYEPAYYEFAKVYAKYPSWGLRPGDVIEAGHLKEIIDAVDYLIDYGVWTSAPICTRRRTPSSYMGHPCGTRHAIEEWEGSDCPEDTNEEYIDTCALCCQNDDECYDEGFACDPYDPPTLEDCRSDCRHETCGMTAVKAGGTCPYFPDPCSCQKNWSLSIVCNDNSSNGCGLHSDGGFACPTQPIGGFRSGERGSCRRDVEGLSYYACSPGHCEHGWDADHGGGFKKNRRDHDWHPGLWIVATGPPGNEFSGNCLGDMFACGAVAPGGEDDGLWFDEVAAIDWAGLAAGVWWSGCDGVIPCEGSGDPTELPPGIPGYGLHDADGNPLCEVTDSGHGCACAMGDFPVCKAEAVWVAVDLNLDGSGRPYRSFSGRNGDLPAYEGRGVPRLRNYDLTKDPATWMHDCPCETWTGANQCAIG